MRRRLIISMLVGIVVVQALVLVYKRANNHIHAVQAVQVVQQSRPSSGELRIGLHFVGLAKTAGVLPQGRIESARQDRLIAQIEKRWGKHVVWASSRDFKADPSHKRCKDRDVVCVFGDLHALQEYTRYKQPQAPSWKSLNEDVMRRYHRLSGSTGQAAKKTGPAHPTHKVHVKKAAKKAAPVKPATDPPVESIAP